jgi:ubiquinone/menaquinone biosynthesis C-methylase UbiE
MNVIDLCKQYLPPNTEITLSNIKELFRKNKDYLIEHHVKRAPQTTLNRIKSYWKKQDSPPQLMCDFGCGSGHKTALLAQSFSLPQDRVIGIDLLNIIPPDILTQITYQQSLQSISSQSVDILTAFMSFHHTDSIETTLNEVARILKPHGLLIIKEHDVSLEESEKVGLLNELHLLLAEAYNGTPLPPTYLHSRQQWCELLAKHNLFTVANSYCLHNLSQWSYYEAFSPSQVC